MNALESQPSQNKFKRMRTKNLSQARIMTMASKFYSSNSKRPMTAGSGVHPRTTKAAAMTKSRDHPINNLNSENSQTQTALLLHKTQKMHI